MPVTTPITSHQSTRERRIGGRRLALGLLGSVGVIALLVGAGSAVAADDTAAALIRPGHVAVTGFSGTLFPAEGVAPGVDPIDETFINPDGISLRLFDLSLTGEKPQGQQINPPVSLEIAARKIGQVFGLAYDDGKRDGMFEHIPNLYATASSAFGVNIVTPDADGDGRPEREKTGTAGAGFMDGQTGFELSGTPGSIYRIDGLTGEPTLFANVQQGGEDNSGPGLGNIAFDPLSRQLFVSDLDTGMIHRFDLDGQDLGQFDHGVNGRPKNGLGAVADDGARMDITQPAFVADDPTTWGLTQAERRIHGLAVKGHRLYYAVLDGLQVWSVGINNDGSFADDAQWELDVKSDTDFPVTDMAFDRQGFLYIAQRGEQKNAFDYALFAEPAKSQVLRYWREVPDDPATPSAWVEVPQEYAIGFPEGHRMTTGGIDLGYGYDEQGLINRSSCDGSLFTTGDDLRNNPALADKLAAGGAFDIHGFQINAKGLVRPTNVPPFSSYFVDYDGFFDDPEVRGHIGDIEVWHPCSGAGYGDVIRYPGTPLVPLDPTCPDGQSCPPPKCIEVEWAEYMCAPGGVDGYLWLKDKAGLGADSLKAQSLTPGISVSPSIQSLADPNDPFVFSFPGALPGDKVDVNVCYFKGADAVPGKPFRCCVAELPLTLPPDVCAP